MLQAARGGDENAYRDLLEPYRGELHAHCYRMLGSVHDAEDALQDASLRAWRGLGKFEGRSSLRSWLYTIATNTCLNQIARARSACCRSTTAPRPTPTAVPASRSWSPWGGALPGRDARSRGRARRPGGTLRAARGVALAFIAALQLLPPNQRAVLILREVLGFSAQEVAESLDTSVASVNSALQRARKTVDDRLPEQSQQATLRALGDDELSEIVERYVEAWEQNDFETVVEMLAEDATFAMPPLATWFGGTDEIPPSSRAGRCPALALAPDPHHGERPTGAGLLRVGRRRAGLPSFALNVLTFRGADHRRRRVRRANHRHPAQPFVWTLGGRGNRPPPAVRELRALRPTRTT